MKTFVLAIVITLAAVFSATAQKAAQKHDVPILHTINTAT
jgi:hypothetical protein